MLDQDYFFLHDIAIRKGHILSNNVWKKSFGMIQTTFGKQCTFGTTLDQPNSRPTAGQQQGKICNCMVKVQSIDFLSINYQILTISVEPHTIIFLINLHDKNGQQQLWLCVSCYLENMLIQNWLKIWFLIDFFKFQRTISFVILVIDISILPKFISYNEV